ncbi:MAG: anti-sigma factor [Pyrinomonadaceae bacterium]
MSEEQKEQLFDLLTKKAVYGLDEVEQSDLDLFDSGTVDSELHSLEITAAAISMVGYTVEEPLPAHLFSKIAANAPQFIGTSEAESAWPAATTAAVYGRDEIFADKPSSSWFGWLGWAAAAAAIIALAVNIGLTRFQPAVEVTKAPSVQTPAIATMAQMREEMLRSTSNMIKANWAPGNVKELKQISGDVVWSDEKQAGYMRFRGLPVNDAQKETYQLWIFDKTQDKATPIDGGTFDVSADGEVVIPINPKLKAQAPEMFAVTVEKAGGVVVSKREKIAALAKVETQTS